MKTSGNPGFPVPPPGITQIFAGQVENLPPEYSFETEYIFKRSAKNG
jgi:hypothetical protein